MSTNTQDKKVALLTLALDFGGSATKIVYATSLDHKARLLCMEPEVAVLARESILEYEGGKLGSSDPENVAWVAVGEQYRAVGYLASSISLLCQRRFIGIEVRASYLQNPGSDLGD